MNNFMETEGLCGTAFCTTSLGSVIKSQTLLFITERFFQHKEEDYFIFHETLAAWLAVVVGWDPNLLNVSSSHSVHFSGADLWGALLWLILVSQV